MTLTQLSIALGAATVISSAALLLCDAAPHLFPAQAHEYLAGFALAFVAVAWFLWQRARRATPAELFRAAILAAAFLFWAANQLWPMSAEATLFNDLAVGLFVLDVFLAMLRWPAN